ncbi:MAG: hypothetical protein QM749_09145 [Aquabacterium sp.]
MRRELVKGTPGEFDIKQGEGGVADIEFLAQYWALLWAKNAPWRCSRTRSVAEMRGRPRISSPRRRWMRWWQVLGLSRAHTSSHWIPAAPGAGGEFEAQRREVTRIWNEVMA